MARNTTKKTEKKTEWVRVIDGVSVKLSKGDFFSLSWFGAVIHGCALRTGRNGDFISWPSFKGSDGVKASVSLKVTIPASSLVLDTEGDGYGGARQERHPLRPLGHQDL